MVVPLVGSVFSYFLFLLFFSINFWWCLFLVLWLCFFRNSKGKPPFAGSNRKKEKEKDTPKWPQAFRTNPRKAEALEWRTPLADLSVANGLLSLLRIQVTTKQHRGAGGCGGRGGGGGLGARHYGSHGVMECVAQKWTLQIRSHRSAQRRVWAMCMAWLNLFWQVEHAAERSFLAPRRRTREFVGSHAKSAWHPTSTFVFDLGPPVVPFHRFFFG